MTNNDASQCIFNKTIPKDLMKETVKPVSSLYKAILQVPVIRDSKRYIADH